MPLALVDLSLGTDSIPLGIRVLMHPRPRTGSLLLLFRTFPVNITGSVAAAARRPAIRRVPWSAIRLLVLFRSILSRRPSRPPGSRRWTWTTRIKVVTTTTRGHSSPNHRPVLLLRPKLRHVAPSGQLAQIVHPVDARHVTIRVTLNRTKWGTAQLIILVAAIGKRSSRSRERSFSAVVILAAAVGARPSLSHERPFPAIFILVAAAAAVGAGPSRSRERSFHIILRLVQTFPFLVRIVRSFPIICVRFFMHCR
mmetsp:Transcript_19988/g.41872  ORF Transcript_19988/g.41872 Transcript_19988/m.41872 type:complete len:254 (-) Transcript_19988:579-1340(-)